MKDRNQPNDLPQEVIYDDLKTVRQYSGMGRTAIYEAVRNSGFPQPYQFGKRIVRWKRTEVLAWMESRKRGTRLSNVQKAQQQEVVA